MWPAAARWAHSDIGPPVPLTAAAAAGVTGQVAGQRPGPASRPALSATWGCHQSAWHAAHSHISSAGLGRGGRGTASTEADAEWRLEDHVSASWEAPAAACLLGQQCAVHVPRRWQRRPCRARPDQGPAAAGRPAGSAQAGRRRCLKALRRPEFAGRCGSRCWRLGLVSRPGSIPGTLREAAGLAFRRPDFQRFPAGHGTAGLLPFAFAGTGSRALCDRPRLRGGEHRLLAMNRSRSAHQRV